MVDLRRRRSYALLLVLALLVLLVGSCGMRDEAEGSGTDGEAPELFPDVIDASAEQDADGSWTFSATLSSPYDSPERYADAWRVVGPDGEVYGTQSGIPIPDGVSTVTIEGRDQISGWGGETFEVALESKSP